MKQIQLQKQLQKRRVAAGLEDLLPAVVAFVLIAIVGAVGALILQNFQSSSSITPNSIAYNATGYGLRGVNTIMSYLPLIALVIVAAILIGIVLLAFAFRGRGEGERF
jgi:NADH:ubiquinone oxidoreductase subunit 5 (subunit L)/multisubunit Na+/H+ antiporter MnhA subunit